MALDPIGNSLKLDKLKRKLKERFGKNFTKEFGKDSLLGANKVILDNSK